MKNIAVFASGRGSNLQAIIDAIRTGTLKVRLSLVVSDKKKAFALTRAQKSGVKTLFLDPKGYVSRRSYEKALVKHLKKEKLDLIVLAGYMRILSPFFVRRYKGKILNIHPALLPSFKGAHAIRDAYRYGVKVTGVTVHIVDEKVDHGPIVLQETVAMRKGEPLAKFEARIHHLEHKLYPQAIRKVLGAKLTLRGRRTAFSTR